MAHLSAYRMSRSHEGRYFIGPGSNVDGPHSFPFAYSHDPSRRLSDLPAQYVQRSVQEHIPINAFPLELVPQMHPDLLLAGKEALFQVRLTTIKDGSVLGVSFSHALAGEHSARSAYTGSAVTRSACSST